MILSGDIGGTKTNLGLFQLEGDRLEPHAERSFASRDYRDLNSIVAEFLASSPQSVSAACFGIAGPVIEGRVMTPNLPWVVEATALAQQLGLARVRLINDLEATGWGVGELSPDELLTINEGRVEPANRALLAAGTGLGTAGLIWDGQRHRVSASEAGHVDFAPTNKTEAALLKHLAEKYGHVSVERVLSGPGLMNIYEFLLATSNLRERTELSSRFDSEDPASVISNAAIAGESQLAAQALDILVSVYGSVAGNTALFFMALGGMYIGGGIAPKIKDRLIEGDFMTAFSDKGRLSSVLKAIPVRIILNDKTALLGAARFAATSGQ